MCNCYHKRIAGTKMIAILLVSAAGAATVELKETLYYINPTAPLWATQARPAHYS
jgi:hypothetical protein